MAKKVKLFRHKTYKSKEELSEFLQELGQKVAEGEIVFKQTPEDFVLEIPNQMTLNVKVNKKKKPAKGTRHKMTIKLTWNERDHQEDPLALG